MFETPSSTSRRSARPCAPRAQRRRRIAAAAALAALALGAAAALSAPLSGTARATAPALASVTPIQGAPQSFADLAQKVSPAVVNISSSHTAQTGYPGMGGEEGGPGAGPEDGPGGGPGSGPQQMPSPFGPMMPFFFFGPTMPGGPQEPNGPMPQPRAVSLGSGFIVDPSGYIVTNNHVIDGADAIKATLADGTDYKATLVGRDPKMDLALLKIEADHPLPYVRFGDSKNARVGDWVLAVGDPFGLGGTVTAGIISARGRDIGSGPFDNYLQIDAPINRGNSGGPTFDMNGEVVGINTAIYSPNGGSVGIGFAIPSDLAQPVVAELKEHGYVARSWLGVEIQPVTKELALGLGLGKPEGALVAQVMPDSPAAKAGIRQGDVILAFDGKDVSKTRELPTIVAQTGIGKSVDVSLWRDGKETSVKVTTERLKDEDQIAANERGLAQEASPAALGELGLKLAPLSPEARAYYRIPDSVDRGALIAGVADNSPAADEGLRPGDVILKVGSKDAASPADVAAALDATREGEQKVVVLLVNRQGSERFVALPLAAA